MPTYEVGLRKFLPFEGRISKILHTEDIFCPLMYLHTHFSLPFAMGHNYWGLKSRTLFKNKIDTMMENKTKNGKRYKHTLSSTDHS